MDRPRAETKEEASTRREYFLTKEIYFLQDEYKKAVAEVNRLRKQLKEAGILVD